LLKFGRGYKKVRCGLHVELFCRGTQTMAGNGKQAPHDCDAGWSGGWATAASGRTSAAAAGGSSQPIAQVRARSHLGSHLGTSGEVHMNLSRRRGPPHSQQHDTPPRLPLPPRREGGRLARQRCRGARLPPPWPAAWPAAAAVIAALAATTAIPHRNHGRTPRSDAALRSGGERAAGTDHKSSAREARRRELRRLRAQRSATSPWGG
jgi:hypothetical protein